MKINEPVGASGQYGDLAGTAKIDGHLGSPLRKIAQECGIDTEDFFPVGLEIYDRGRNDTELTVALLVVKTGQYGQTREEIQAAVRDEGGKTLELRRIDTGRSLLDVMRHFKRVDFVLTSSLVRELEKSGVEPRVVESIDPTESSESPRNPS